MKNKKTAKQTNSKPSTQAHIPIAAVKDGVLVLKDSTLRMVLLVSSINFSLKSEDEQNAIISSYVSFLNALDFPLQIVAQSRKLQIQPYLNRLIESERTQTNELLRMQTADYRAFVEELVEIGQIMTKRFYVVVPYDPLSNKKKSWFARVKEVTRPAKSIILKEERFQKRREDIDRRVREVQTGLEGIGLAVVPLDTQALVELYYNTYNPELALSESLAKVEEIRIENT
ncbi:hypothetical protein KJ641_00295 [Patescibacteria group bacterium]|nr:hypothetical protein [Patescibacteria group bacterium]MBU1895298.1 hypothetical protein [Patescibacteria group bacterium]